MSKSNPIVATIQGMIEHEDEFLEQIGIKREEFDPDEMLRRIGAFEKHLDVLGAVLARLQSMEESDPGYELVKIEAAHAMHQSSDAMRLAAAMAGVAVFLRSLEGRSVPFQQLILSLLAGSGYDVSNSKEPLDAPDWIADSKTDD